jgi:hypothetical protein
MARQSMVMIAIMCAESITGAALAEGYQWLEWLLNQWL